MRYLCAILASNNQQYHCYFSFRRKRKKEEKMNNEPLNREVTVQFSENEFSTMSFVSLRLGLSIPDLIRSFVPSLPISKESDNTPLQTLAHPSPQGGPYRIREDLDKDRIVEILNELFDEKDKAITLAKEIKSQIVDDESIRETLNLTTEKRLLRWAHPARVDDRTRFAKPRAREICMILYGFIPERQE
jgi:hypothetical protein